MIKFSEIFRSGVLHYIKDHKAAKKEQKEMIRLYGSQCKELSFYIAVELQKAFIVLKVAVCLSFMKAFRKIKL